MENRIWILTLAVVLALGGGLGACVAMGDGGVGEALTAEIPDSPSIVFPGDDDPVYVPDGGMEPGFEMPGMEMDVPVEPEVELEREAVMEMPENEEATAGDPQVEYDYAAEAARICGENICGDGERCCYPAGICIPTDCQDCCDQLVDPPTDPPRLVPPDGPGPV